MKGTAQVQIIILILSFTHMLCHRFIDLRPGLLAVLFLSGVNTECKIMNIFPQVPHGVTTTKQKIHAVGCLKYIQQGLFYKTSVIRTSYFKSKRTVAINKGKGTNVLFLHLTILNTNSIMTRESNNQKEFPWKIITIVTTMSF